MSQPRPDREPAIFVSDGATRQALAVVRSLGRRGYPVHVLSPAKGSLAGASRYCTSERSVPSVEDDPAAWVRAVRGHVDGAGEALLLPVTEAALGSLYHFGWASPVAAPPRDAYATAVDKHALLELAAELGLRVPVSTLVEDPARLTGLPAGHRFPVVVKARRSRWLEADGWRRGTVHVARDAAELAALAREPGLAAGALVQEFVAGSGEGLFLLADRGTSRVRFAHRRVREKPPGGGVSVVSESIPADPGLLERGEALLARLGWHGAAMLEFRREPGGGAVLMELNPRLWGSLQLAIDAGVDFPALLVALHRGETLPEVAPRIGVRLRWLLGDLDRTWIALRHAEHRREPRRRTLAGLVGEFFRSSRSEVLRWNDPRPFGRELALWLRRREGAL